jgi:hypothetical protein
MKTCTKCKESKPLSSFYRHNTHKSGYRYECKSCSRIVNVNYCADEGNKKKLRDYQRKYAQTEEGKKILKSISIRYTRSEKGKVARRRNVKIFRQGHPLQVQAMEAVRCAIRRGAIPRPDSLICSCGEKAKQYHHYKGYAKENWLDVIAKCIPCHVAIHRKVKT